MSWAEPSGRQFGILSFFVVLVVVSTSLNESLGGQVSRFLSHSSTGFRDHCTSRRVVRLPRTSSNPPSMVPNSSRTNTFPKPLNMLVLGNLNQDAVGVVLALCYLLNF